MKYAVIVSDPAGWEIECPDLKERFFAHVTWPAPARYVHPYDGGQGRCGHVEVEGEIAAVKLCVQLNNSGDWLAPDTGQIARPTYSTVKL